MLGCTIAQRFSLSKHYMPLGIDALKRTHTHTHTHTYTHSGSFLFIESPHKAKKIYKVHDEL